MSLKTKNARPLLLAGALVFAAGIWPTLYSPLGEDTAGNPMRENRFTGEEEIKPAGSSEWVNAAAYLEQTRAKEGSLLVSNER